MSDRQKVVAGLLLDDAVAVGVQAFHIDLDIVRPEFLDDLLKRIDRRDIPEMGLLKPQNDAPRRGLKVNLVIQQIGRGEEDLSPYGVDIGLSFALPASYNHLTLPTNEPV